MFLSLSLLLLFFTHLTTCLRAYCSIPRSYSHTWYLGDDYQYYEVSWFLGSFPASHRQVDPLAREEGAEINLSKKLTYLLRWTNSRISVFSSLMTLNSHGSIPGTYVVGSD